MSIKVVHIHTDYKFVYNTNIFEGKICDNTIVVFKKKESYNGPFQDRAQLYEREQINAVIELCKKADLVVLYDLDIIKSRIALALPNNIKIAWRFFGYELYSKMEASVLSEKSLSLVKAEKKTFFEYLLTPIYKVYHFVKFKGSTYPKIFYKAMNRIDYMLVLFKNEYEFLEKHWEVLPEFINLPFKLDKYVSFWTKEQQVKKNKTIVIGNNRSSYNNHIDVIDLIDKIQNKHEHTFTFLFNYGSENTYTEEVRRQVKGKPFFSLIEDFIPRDKFLDFYTNISALVINGYRQMAVGNILLAFRCGVKVYLNERNPVFTWLINHGFDVFNIEKLPQDIEDNNITLDYNVAVNNLTKLEEIESIYSVEDFQNYLRKKFLIELSHK